MRIGLVQLSSSDDPLANLPITVDRVCEAADQGADLILTPEVTNCVSTSRRHQQDVLVLQEHDPTLAALMEVARERQVWISIGSLGLKTADTDGRFANRSFVINHQGEIAAHYDKVHMFDVDIDAEESYRESDGYRPGENARAVRTPFATIGMAICYDLRFPHLFRDLAKAGAEILLVPAAFSPVTGAAHWEPLLRARAIENGCFVLAAAQCDEHQASRGKSRKTHGHSLAVDPWGTILADGGTDPGVTLVNLDLDAVRQTRKRLPSLSHDRPYQLRHDG
ncbi:MAG: carbon-nitrogen hydrolase family protein [Pseudomonadota bacterium]